MSRVRARRPCSLRWLSARAAVALVVGALAAACGGSDAPARFEAVGAWARPTPPGAANGVVYLTLTTDVADSLVGASVDPAVAAAVELHATTAGEGRAGHAHGGGGGETMTMAEVEAFPLEPGEPLVFEPGANHLMLVDVVVPLERGERVALQLRFSSGRTLPVEAVVADNPPDRP